MRPALAYRPGHSSLHRANPGPALIYLGALASVGFLYSSPIVLVSVIATTAAVGAAAGAGRAIRASLRLALPLLLLMVAVNALVTHRGETVLIRGFEMPVIGNTDVTLESLAAGATIGLRVVAVILVFAVYSACVDPDRVLRALRPLARRSAMTAGLVTRMVPLAASDGSRLREAVALRGPGAAPVGNALLARRLVEGSLDRAVDVAATLELRGHSLGVRPQVRREPSRADLPLLTFGMAIFALSVVGAAAGIAGFEIYPLLDLETGPATWGLCAATALLALAPFARRPGRRG